MVPSILETFRLLASFDPPRGSLANAPWEAYADWAIAQGLAPLAAYNLEYRMGGAGAPQWARDRLLSIYQGTLNDAVMKLVGFKRVIGALEGRKVVLLGAAALAEALYPHVAFRPVEAIHLLVSSAEVSALGGFLQAAELRPVPARAGEEGAALVASDGRTDVFVHGGLLGNSTHDAELVARATPLKVYGPSVHRLELEDALLTHCLAQARAGYAVPAITFGDLRELLLGASERGGAYARPPDADKVLTRARAWRLERALYTSLRITTTLFPETEVAAAALMPPLRAATRALLERAVVGPVAQLPLRFSRGADRLRRLLSGGR